MQMEYVVRLADTDAAGVLFSPALARILHGIYEEFMEKSGHPITRYLKGPVALPVVHFDLDFRKPVRHGDRLSLSIVTASCGSTSFRMRYRVMRGDALVAEGSTVHVALRTSTGKATPLPAALRRALTANGCSK